MGNSEDTLRTEKIGITHGTEETNIKAIITFVGTERPVLDRELEKFFSGNQSSSHGTGFIPGEPKFLTGILLFGGWFCNGEGYASSCRKHIHFIFLKDLHRCLSWLY